MWCAVSKLMKHQLRHEKFPNQVGDTKKSWVSLPAKPAADSQQRHLCLQLVSFWLGRSSEFWGMKFVGKGWIPWLRQHRAITSTLGLKRNKQRKKPRETTMTRKKRISLDWDLCGRIILYHAGQKGCDTFNLRASVHSALRHLNSIWL